jgi:mono/diheme cytochrome c family protein
MRTLVAFIFCLIWLTVSYAAEPGKQNYILRCAGCHLTDGAGKPEAGIPDLRNNVGLFLNTEAGRRFLIQVPGVAHAPLSDREIAQVVQWMLVNFSTTQIPADFVPYTAEEVHAYRQHQPEDVFGLRHRVIAELQNNGIAVK